ncbi:MAG TPA: hypothetical protein VGG11_00030 [Xanthobacteraceae bacterium]
MLELLCCPQGCFTAERSAARGPGAAAHRRTGGIATDDHNYIGIDPHFLRNDLNQRGASTLALIGDAGHAHNAAVVIKIESARFVSRDTDLLIAIESRPNRGLLDKRGYPDAAIDAAVAQLALPPAQLFVVHEFQEPIVTLMKR